MWLEVLYWINHVWSSLACVCVHVVPVSVHMLLPYVCLGFCMSEVISSFKSLRTGLQVFALLMLFLCVILHTMSLGKSLKVCILVGMVVWAKSGLCVFRELCPVSFRVVGECPSVLL